MNFLFKKCVLSHVRLFTTPLPVTHRVPLFLEFTRPEHWSGLHLLPRGISLSQGLNPHLLYLPHWQVYLYRPSRLGSQIPYPSGSFLLSLLSSAFHILLSSCLFLALSSLTVRLCFVKLFLMSMSSFRIRYFLFFFPECCVSLLHVHLMERRLSAIFT